MLHEGWRGAMTPFLLAIVLDCIYQFMTVEFVYPLELIFMATLLALVPTSCYAGRFIACAPFLVGCSRAPLVAT